MTRADSARLMDFKEIKMKRLKDNPQRKLPGRQIESRYKTVNEWTTLLDQ